MTRRTLPQILRHTRHIFLDFDGPVCGVFTGTPASQVADRFRQALQTAGIEIPPAAAAEPDPLEIFRTVADTSPGTATEAQQILTKLEIQAIATARPDPGSAGLIATARQTGRTVAIISNNSKAAIAAYLDAHQLNTCVQGIYGRDSNPKLMKPSPYLVREAVANLGAEPGECAFIGDSPTDVLAGRLAGVCVIGYANKPGKTVSLAQAHAAIVTTRLADISTALRSAPLAALPNLAVLDQGGSAALRRGPVPRRPLALGGPGRRGPGQHTQQDT